jgi:SAM-dependent methyltransferase
MKSFMPAVVEILKQHHAKVILDAPCGGGWLKQLIDWEVTMDGIDLFDSSASGYNNLFTFDLDKGLPKDIGLYDAIATCEGIEHLGNPLLFLESCREHLVDDGLLVVTTPNIWHPASKLKFLTRGFFPGFPSLGGKVERGTHMHIMPWSFPWLWMYLKLAGFSSIQLAELDEPKPKYFFEKILAAPQRYYCQKQFQNSKTVAEKEYWKFAGSDQSIYGRRLVVYARK